jgi:nucleoside-diphosphate-sugar epimerase
VTTDSRSAGQQVLITGASGFIGSHLAKALSQNGGEVHAVSRFTHSSADLRWWQVDLEDISSVRKLLRTIRPDTIFHLSGHVTAAPDLEFALSTFRSHVVSTVHLLTSATELGYGRVVLSASLTEPKSHCADAIPSSPYAAAKWASSAYGRMFHELYQTPVTIVRPFMTYGPQQNPQKIIPYVILSLLRGQSPRLASGTWQADWIYIDDVVEGILAAAHITADKASTIDLGSGALTPVRGVVERLVKLVGTSIEPSFGALPDRPAEELRIADVGYARTQIDWQPTTSLEKGLALTVDWYREQLLKDTRGVEHKEALT